MPVKNGLKLAIEEGALKIEGTAHRRSLPRFLGAPSRSHRSRPPHPYPQDREAGRWGEDTGLGVGALVVT